MEEKTHILRVHVTNFQPGRETAKNEKSEKNPQDSPW